MSENGQQLPHGWALVPLQSLLLPTETTNPAKWTTPDFVYVDIEALDNTRQIISSPRRIPCEEAPSRARNLLRTGDVVFSLVRPYLKNIATVSPDLDGAVGSTAYFVCRPGKGVDSRFLLNLLRRDSFIHSVTTYGSSPPAARDDEFQRLQIPLAPASEQSRIADTLDELLPDLDAGVAALVRVREKLKLFRASVLKAAVEGALTAEWREQHPQVEPASESLKRILAERRRRWEEDQRRKFKEKGQAPPKNWKAKYKEPVAPDTTNLPPLPDEWCWVSVDQLLASAIINGISVRGRDTPPGIPALRLSAMSENGFDYSAKRYLPLHPKDVDDLWIRLGDFFVSRGNGSKHLVGRGTLAQEPPELVIFPDTMMRLRIFGGSLSQRWVSTIWNCGLVRRQVERLAKTTAGIWKLAQPDVAGISLPMPLPDEQEKIIEMVEDQLSVIDHLENTLDTKLKSAEALRQSILRHAFTGQLVPQDSTDEPASELLKRIAAERAARARESTAMKKNGKQAKQASGRGRRRTVARKG